LWASRLLGIRDEFDEMDFVELVYSKLGKGYQKSASRDQEARRKAKMRIEGKILRVKMAGCGGRKKEKDNAEYAEERRGREEVKECKSERV